MGREEGDSDPEERAWESKDGLWEGPLQKARGLPTHPETSFPGCIYKEQRSHRRTRSQPPLAAELERGPALLLFTSFSALFLLFTICVYSFDKNNSCK